MLFDLSPLELTVLLEDFPSEMDTCTIQILSGYEGRSYTAYLL